MDRSHMWLGTGALFQQIFVTEKRVQLDKISLIAFDECNNACGTSPMAVVMRDGVAPFYQNMGLLIKDPVFWD